MKSLVLSIMGWIGANSGYPPDLAWPNIVFTTQHNLCAQYGISDMGQCDAAQLAGFYDKKVTVFLRTGFDPHSPADQSRLLHELVHYLQWHTGLNKGRCLGHLELEAHDLQDKWRAQHALGPSINEFRRILLGASCA